MAEHVRLEAGFLLQLTVPSTMLSNIPTHETLVGILLEELEERYPHMEEYILHYKSVGGKNLSYKGKPVFQRTQLTA